MPATPSNAEARASRRDFLSWSLKGLLGASALTALGGLVRFLNFETEPPPQKVFDLGPATDYPEGTRTAIAGAQAVLLRDANGYRALSLICPHLGCEVEMQTDGFACPCHGSKFNVRGDRTAGPTPRGLDGLRLELTAEGHLILHKD